MAWRNITSNKLFTSLNIGGLAIGMCVCISLFAYISYELSFDRTYQHSKDIYRVNMVTTAQFNYEIWAQVPNAVGPAIAESVPQVQRATRLIKQDFGAKASLKTDDKTFTEKGLYLADKTVFDMFDIRFTEGNAATAFSQPRSVVLSASASKRLYGNSSAIGKIIYVNNNDTLHVSGVYEDLPVNSSIDCDMIYNIMDAWYGKYVHWSNASYETYCQVQPGADIKQVEAQATALIDKHVTKDDKYFSEFQFQPLTRIHLYSGDIRESYAAHTGSITTVKALIFLSLLVLIIACINYMNLATARSQKRAKGVGVNKVLGAEKRHLLALFYMETALLSFIAIVVGYALTFAVQPLFQAATGITLSTSTFFTPPVLLSLLSIWVLVTLIAGSYPAFSISGISPLVLMNKLKLKYSFANFIRRTLVVFQFASSIILIIAVIVIYQQMQYIRNKDLGYNPNGVVSVNMKAAQSRQQVSSFINTLHTMPDVASVSSAQSIPGDVESGKTIRKHAADKEGLPISSCRTDGSIVQTMQLKLLAGSPLPVTIAAGDTVCYTLVNETVARYLGYKTPEEAIGQYVSSEMASKTIITGVVKDFNYQSLKNKVGGYVYYSMNKAQEPLRILLIRYNTQNVAGFMQQLQSVFKTGLPNSSFDYEFLDSHIQNLYTSEQHTANVATLFSLLAIFVACLGLFGLAAFIAEQRTKEIGIRKVLGASVSGITRLLTSDFLKLVLIAILIASPIAWYAMNQWLTSFSYRIHINALAFVIAGSTSILLALLTISSHAIKAAIANPVKSLRNQ